MISRLSSSTLPAPAFWRLLSLLLVLGSLVAASCGFDVPDVVSAADAKEGEEDKGPTTWRGPGFVTVNDVVATPFGLVAVGSDVWLSSDGRNWERLFLEDAQGTWGSSVMNAVIWDGRRLIAVGQRRGDNSVWGNAAIWFSADGRSWRAVPNDGAFSNVGAVTINDITIGAESGRMVAVGESANYEDSADPQVKALAWTSTDGINWSAANLPNNEVVFGDPIVIKSVVSTPSGFAAAGTHIWTTRNGLDWEMGTTADAGFTGATDLVVTPQVLSALGQPAWRSTNGVDWFTIENGVAPNGLRAAATGPTGAIAFAADQFDRYAPYTSPDGFDWTPQDGSAFEVGDRVNSVIPTAAGWVAVGSSGDQGRVWLGTGNTWRVVNTGNVVIEPPTGDERTDNRSQTGLVTPDAAPETTTTLEPETPEQELDELGDLIEIPTEEIPADDVTVDAG